MFEDYNICPYPGLRTFQEDESIYFKGRDQHTIEVVEQLQRNKFLMVTGASGDGKSSLIFGGLIPNARAGFFKSRYNNWKVAHFKPERTPLQNLSQAVSSEFGNKNPQTLETEFSRGFSSLADLYINSEYYSEDPEVRVGSNLLIVADQFEEFFTNPENFVKGAPTQSAQVTVNLLLETARIAISKNLPIYVIFTMRSDFIGQCSAFRGLPEFIGFSQFFVPRLKRKDLSQVIEEPALLSGNKITRRLSERLLYDLEDGIDQLPMLQHALNRIWTVADKGKEEMDLIHYAKVGGISVDELPEADADEFNRWFAKLPKWKKELYSEASLQKVLDIHADELYLNTYLSYKASHPQSLLQEKDVKRVVAMVFACLTKIDESRAVRNRMTLSEITSIINTDGIDQQTVSDIIELFRISGNTFISPFIEEDNPESKTLNGDSVLDITHEALIRNWKRLDKWAWKEFEYLETLQDLTKQVNHWVENNKSSKFLLPIGPLFYFEEWVKKVKPNKFWVNRYLEEKSDSNESLLMAESQLLLMFEFLWRSSSKLFLTKFVSKVGVNKILTVSSIIIVAILSSIFFIKSLQKQNSVVVKELINKGFQFDENNKAVEGDEIFFIASAFTDSLSTFTRLREIEDLSDRFAVSAFGYSSLNFISPGFNDPIKIAMLEDALATAKLMVDEGVKSEFTTIFFNGFSAGLIADEYFNPASFDIKYKIQLKEIFLKYILNIIDEKNLNFNSGVFNKSIDMLLLLGLSKEELNLVLDKLSPFRNNGLKNFEYFFPKGNSLPTGYTNSLNFKAGYQLMGSLYASTGDINKVKQCYDSIIKYNTGYYDLRSYNDDFTHAGFLLRYNHRDEFKSFVDFMAVNRNIPTYEIYKLLCTSVTGVDKPFFRDYYSVSVYLSTHNKFQSYSDLLFLFDEYEKAVLEKAINEDEKFYELAVSYKNKGIYLQRTKEKRGLLPDTSLVNEAFQQSIEAYRKVSETYLEEPQTKRVRYNAGDVRVINSTKKDLFIYPDHHGDGFHSSPYNTTAFLTFIYNNDLIDELYTTSEEAKLINEWLINFNERIEYRVDFRFYQDPDYSTLEKVSQKLRSKFQNGEFDFNFLEIMQGLEAIETGNDDKFLEHISAINMDLLPVSIDQLEYLNKSQFKNHLISIATQLIKINREDLIFKLIKSFPNDKEKVTVYSIIARLLQESNQKYKTFTYLDSALVLYEKTKGDIKEGSWRDFNPTGQLVLSLASTGSVPLLNKAKEIVRNTFTPLKADRITAMAYGNAINNNYNAAIEVLPDDLSEGAFLKITNLILIENLRDFNNLSKGKNNFIKNFHENYNYEEFY